MFPVGRHQDCRMLHRTHQEHATEIRSTTQLRGIAKKNKFKISELTMDVGGSRSLEKKGKFSQISPIPVLIFCSSIPCV